MTIKHLTIIQLIKSFCRHIWLSISSVEFYENIYLKYKGYGLKYTFIACFISAFLYVAILLNYLAQLDDYLQNNKIPKNIQLIDHIFSQIPDMKYDGLNISIEGELPIYINKPDNVTLITIDPENKLTPSERSKVPVLINNQNILVKLYDDKNTHKTIPIKINEIFGSHELNITQSTLKSYLSNLINKSSPALIYLGLPLLSLLLILKTITDLIITIGFIYILAYAIKIRPSFESAMRMVLFSNGIIMILEPIVKLLVPHFLFVTMVARLWTAILMYQSMLKISRKKIKFK